MKRWYSALVTPPDTHDDVLVVYKPTLGGRSRIGIAFLMRNGEWRLAQSQLRIHPLAWQPTPALPDLDRIAVEGAIHLVADDP